MKSYPLRIMIIATLGFGLGACAVDEAGYGSSYAYPEGYAPYGGYYGGYYGSPSYEPPFATGFAFGQERFGHGDFEDRRREERAHPPAPNHPGPAAGAQTHAAPPAKMPNHADARPRAGSSHPVATSPARGQPPSHGQAHGNEQHGQPHCAPPGCAK